MGLFMNKQPVLQVSQLYKKIGRYPILENITFDMRPGEIVGLLGPNGSGKTTLLKCIVGLLKPTKGRVIIHDADLQKKFERAIRHVGAIVENPELYDFLTGYENLIHFSRMNPDVPDERLDEVIQLLDMEDYINQKVFTYSLGMRQRLGLGQAILHRPSILLLDEPTNGLDPAGIKDLRNHLQSLAQKEEVAVLISSHILAEIEQICDQVVVLNEGKMIDQGPIDSFKENALNHSYYFFKVTDVERAQYVLSQSPELGKNAEMQANGFSIQTSEEKAAELNSRLVQENIKVYAMERVQPSLEEAFFRKVER